MRSRWSARRVAAALETDGGVQKMHVAVLLSALAPSGPLGFTLST
jgi:hypothetical protein